MWPQLIELAKATHKDIIHRLIGENAAVTVVADGAWSQRRNANQHCLVMLVKGVPVHIVCLSRTIMRASAAGPAVWMEGNLGAEQASNVMESTCWARVAGELDEVDPSGRFRRLVTRVCVDRDNKVTASIQVRPC